MVDDGAGGKIPYRKHIESLARQGDLDAQAELFQQPKLPPPAAYLWTYFHQLNATRGSNGFGLNPITRLDVRLWETDECRRLEGWERSALLKIDAAFLRSSSAIDDNPTG